MWAGRPGRCGLSEGPTARKGHRRCLRFLENGVTAEDREETRPPGSRSGRPRPPGSAVWADAWPPPGPLLASPQSALLVAPCPWPVVGWPVPCRPVGGRPWVALGSAVGAGPRVFRFGLTCCHLLTCELALWVQAPGSANEVPLRMRTEVGVPHGCEAWGQVGGRRWRLRRTRPLGGPTREAAAGMAGVPCTGTCCVVGGQEQRSRSVHRGVTPQNETGWP